MVLLVCFALAYAVTGAMAQVGRDARGGARSIRQRAWSTATRRVANMRAAGPRHVGWWLWLTGATAYHSARYTVRGSRAVGRSVRTGWSAGWRKGRNRYEQRLARRTAVDRDQASARTVADRWAGTTAYHAPGSGPADDPMTAAASPGGSGPFTDQGQTDVEPVSDEAEGADGAVASPAHVAYPHEPGYPYDCPACEGRCHRDGDPGSSECVFDGPHRMDPAAEDETDRHGAGWSNGNGTGAEVMASSTTGEAPNIEAARDALQALRAEAEQTVARVDQLSASLQSADLDAQTLGEVAEVLEAADVMKTAADKALSGMQSRHAVMEEAVNSTQHAARTDWYRH